MYQVAVASSLGTRLGVRPSVQEVFPSAAQESCIAASPVLTTTSRRSLRDRSVGEEMGRNPSGDRTRSLPTRESRKFRSNLAKLLDKFGEGRPRRATTSPSCAAP